MKDINSVFYYRPQTKLREGNVFTPICDSVRGGGGVIYQHAIVRVMCVSQHGMGRGYTYPLDRYPQADTPL